LHRQQRLKCFLASFAAIWNASPADAAAILPEAREKPHRLQKNRNRKQPFSLDMM